MRVVKLAIVYCWRFGNWSLAVKKTARRSSEVPQSTWRCNLRLSAPGLMICEGVEMVGVAWLRESKARGGRDSGRRRKRELETGCFRFEMSVSSLWSRKGSRGKRVRLSSKKADYKWI